jgi:hypothetical protein
MSHAQIKPTHNAIKTFHATLADFAAFKAKHEGATEAAFGRLLSDTSRGVDWTLISKQSMKVDYRLNNRSALGWGIDESRVT